MKKSFWGYQAKEVDEAIDALTKQNTSLVQRNDHLEDELKNMHVQLEEMKANVDHSMTQAQFDEYKELKVAYAALQNRMQDEVDDSERVQELEEKLRAALQEAETPDTAELEEARRQNQDLEAALESARQEIAGKDAELMRKDAELAQKDTELAQKDTELRSRDELLGAKDAELAQLKEQAAQPAFARQRDLGVVEINEMMKRVGDAIYETKTNTYRNMMGAVEDFTRQWEESNGQLEEILRDFDAEKDKTRQELLDTVQLILHQFDRMALKSDSMHANLQNLTAKRAELRDKLELTVEQLRSEPVQTGAEQPVAARQETEQFSDASSEEAPEDGGYVNSFKKHGTNWFSNKKN